MRWFSTLCLLAVNTMAFAAGEAKQAPTAQATGLSIRKPLPPKKKEGFVFSPAGTTLNVTISAPGRYIIGIDAKASKLDHFSDDKQTKLNGSGLFTSSWLSDYVSILPDGEQCTAEIRGTNVPVKGAGKILAKATLILKCGAGEKASEKKEIAMKKDTAVAVGAFSLRVTGEGSNFGGGSVAIVSETRNVKSAEFFDAKGNAIKTVGTPFWSPFFGGGDGKMRQALTYHLPKKIDAVSVKFTYFDKVEMVSVPFDLRVGIGLD
jgi:hypothetical protein